MIALIAPALEAVGCYRWRDAAYKEVFPGYGEGWKAKIVLPSDLMDSDRPTDLVAEGDPRRLRELLFEKLGLKPEPVSTQVIPRDRHAMFFAPLGVIASSIEKKTRLSKLWLDIKSRVFPRSTSNHHLGTLLGLVLTGWPGWVVIPLALLAGCAEEGLTGPAGIEGRRREVEVQAVTPGALVLPRVIVDAAAGSQAVSPPAGRSRAITVSAGGPSALPGWSRS